MEADSQADSPSATQTAIDTPFLIQGGNYSVTSGGNPVKFWPLDPENLDSVVGVFEAAADVLPSPFSCADFSTLALPPAFGIFDIAIEFSEDPIELHTIDPPAVSEQYCTYLMGQGTVNKMPIVVTWPEARICFAVPIKQSAKEFIGKLRLETQIKDTNFKKHLDLPIRVAKYKRADNLFIYFASHKRPGASVNEKPKPEHCWCQLKVVDAADDSPLPGAAVKLKILRDNHRNGYDKINRRVELTSNDEGAVSYHGPKRDVLGLPIEWPLVINTEYDGYVPRGHWLKLAADDIDHNLLPVTAPADRVVIPMTQAASADISSKKIMLDPGHGVVYNNSNRRCQEWYVAHMVGEKIAELLNGPPYNVPADNIYWTRTAGFGLIDPHNVHTEAAPEDGDLKFKFDLPGRRIRTLQANLTLKDISDLLLTTHGEDDSAQPVAESDRTRLLNNNHASVAAIVARINAAKAPHHQRVRPDSVRWDSDADDYIYTLERTNAPADQDPLVDDSVPFPIKTTDWFVVDAAMLQVLADRSARWSYRCEIGSGPAADAGTNRPAFAKAARDSMGTGARDYMRDRIMRYLNVTAPHPYLDHGIKGWSPNHRITFFNGQDCDLFLTLHENASGGIGGEVLASRMSGANKAPDDQITLGKIFMKYIDPFDRGIRGEAVTQEEPGSQPGSGSVGMLHASNQKRGTYVYIESEFMDAIDPDDPSKYTYDSMVQGQFIGTLAEQIVEACVEALLNPQANLDDITFNGTFSLW